MSLLYLKTCDGIIWVGAKFKRKRVKINVHNDYSIVRSQACEGTILVPSEYNFV